MSHAARQRRQLILAAAALAATAAAAEATQGRWRRAHRRGFLASTIFLAPTLIRNSRFCGSVVSSFATDAREVWLTLDDGPHPDHTPEILDVLARHGARAVFFAIGRNIRHEPELTRRVVAEGHLLQNHTDTHPAGTFWTVGPRRAAREISRCSDAIDEITGMRPSWFRAPAGLANPFVHAAVEKIGLRMMGWSASGFDGVRHHPDTVLRKILARVRPGSIVLLHESSLPSMENGVRARTLDRLLYALRDRGYKTALPAV